MSTVNDCLTDFLSCMVACKLKLNADKANLDII